MSVYTYKGFSYEPYEDVEPEENIKIIHEVIKPEGGFVILDWSPYQQLSEEHFKMFVDCGFPDRFSTRNFGGPLSPDELNDVNFARIQEEVRQNLIQGALS